MEKTRKVTQIHLFLILLLVGSFSAYAGTTELQKALFPNAIFHANYSKSTATLYGNLGINNSDYIAYSDAPRQIQKFITNLDSPLKVLDFGCGAAKSSLYLKSLNYPLDIEGVDINSNMLEEARRLDPFGVYKEIASDHKIPSPDLSYDLVYSSFVLLELASYQEMEEVFGEIFRVLKPTGVFIATTTSTALYDPRRSWANFETGWSDFSNQPKSGQRVQLIQAIDDEQRLCFEDYYWTEADYLAAFQGAGFQILEISRPVGTAEDEEKLGIQWRDERTISPYVSFVLKKKTP